MRGAASLVVMALLAACSAAAPSSEPPSPIASEVPVRPGVMVVDPAAARPGQGVAARFPGGWDRGILFALDAEAGDGWDRRWMLISDASGGEPSWFSSDEDVAVEAIGISGEGPDHRLIPDAAERGAYRLCTANAGEDVCAPIEIEAADGG